MISFCRKLGFTVTELPDRKSVDIAPQFRVTCGKVPFYDQANSGPPAPTYLCERFPTSSFRGALDPQLSAAGGLSAIARER